MTFFFRDMEERFTYDLLDRLTGVVEGLDTTGVFAYDDYGRMTMKYIHGDTVFDQTAYNAGGRPHALKTARMYSYQPDMEMAYTSFDKLQRIQTGNTTLSYRYGYEHQRLRMDETVGNDTVRTKIYVGNCEYVTEGSGTHSTSHWITYISGPLGVFAVRDTRMHPDSKQMYYVHPDHLGSWTTVTGWNGAVVQDVWFDPWGTAHNITPGGEPSPVFSLLFDRGFTGHEHMMEFGLINMNGRVYDPVTSSFLSVDNYVQDPSYTQNFNRYAYCMNNPLKYTDPDGEWAHLVIGALVGGIVNLATNWGHINTFGEGLAYFGIGAAAGAVGAATGGAAAGVFGTIGFVGASLTGVSSGFASGFVTGAGNAWLQGSSFGQGYCLNENGYFGKLSGGEVYGTTVKSSVFNHSEVFVSPRVVDGYLFTYDIPHFHAVVGHELTHAYHIFRGASLGSTMQQSQSEAAALDCSKAIYNYYSDFRAQSITVPWYHEGWKVPASYPFSIYNYP